MRRNKVFKKVKLTESESDLIFRLVIEERNRLIKDGEYTDLLDDFLIKNYSNDVK